MEHDMKLLDEVNDMYKLVNKLFILCIRRGLRLVMENPYSEEHFLRRYWCFLPAIIDRDRRENGDYYKKPTQYWFLNIEPANNLIWEAIPYHAIECKDAIRMATKADFEKSGGVAAAGRVGRGVAAAFVAPAPAVVIFGFSVTAEALSAPAAATVGGKSPAVCRCSWLPLLVSKEFGMAPLTKSLQRAQYLRKAA